MTDYLTSVPITDVTFAIALEKAGLEELNDALEHATTQHQKTRYNKLRSEIHRRFAESSYDYEKLPAFAEAEAAAAERIKADEIIIGRFLYPDQSAPSLLMMCDYDPKLARIAYDRAEDPTRKQELARLLHIPDSAAPVADAELAIPDEDAISGAALTEQYHLAVGGMRHVLRFGVLMMQLRDRLSTVLQVRSAVGAFAEKDGGSMKKWLAKYAPEIKESTAYRFLHVAEAVASEFQTPAKVSFIDLVTSATADLSEKLQIKQAELWEFVDGTSQRSWLDRFAPATPFGGDTRKIDAETGERINHAARRTDEEIAQENFDDMAQLNHLRFQGALGAYTATRGPRDERAWWTLSPHDLGMLKGQLWDIYQEVKDYEQRRNTLNRTGAR